MKHKVAELQGALLDAAVALAEGWSRMPYGEGWRAPRYMAGLDNAPLIDASTFEPVPWPWSTDWTYGGPLLEREAHTLEAGSDGWRVTVGAATEFHALLLVAFCRAHVASKFGNEIDLPP